MPRILVLFVKLGAHILAAVAARTLNMHIAYIRTLRISVRSGPMEILKQLQKNENKILAKNAA